MRRSHKQKAAARRASRYQRKHVACSDCGEIVKLPLPTTCPFCRRALRELTGRRLNRDRRMELRITRLCHMEMQAEIDGMIFVDLDRMAA